MIFIIDDDKNVLRGFQMLLKSAGLVCCVFDTIEEFLCKWIRNEGDMLILDIHMPGINGCDLLDYLEKTNLHIPIIIITAYDQSESRSKSERYGVLAYLTKPVDGEVLLDLVQNRKIKQVNVY